MRTAVVYQHSRITVHFYHQTSQILQILPVQRLLAGKNSFIVARSLEEVSEIASCWGRNTSR